MSRPRLLLDTSVAVLLVVGLADPRLIATHKRLRQYDRTDFEILREIVRHASEVVVTPHVLAETSNLARMIGGPARLTVSASLAHLVGVVHERVVSGREAVVHPSYPHLGLTDAALLLAAEGRDVVLTDDLDLYLAGQKIGLEIVNFTHVREARRPDFQ